MYLARVKGTVVATQKDASMTGSRFLVLEKLDERLKPLKEYIVAVDAVGSGEDEVVMYASGSSARQTRETKDRPADAVVMAIIDSVTIGGKTVFTK
ncbi:MAG: EutN/CcmL family microcompartment protein [Spirochaetota bacterium]